MPALENDNCVNECTSPACYQLVYGKEPVRWAARTTGAGQGAGHPERTCDRTVALPCVPHL